MGYSHRKPKLDRISYLNLIEKKDNNKREEE